MCDYKNCGPFRRCSLRAWAGGGKAEENFEKEQSEGIVTLSTNKLYICSLFPNHIDAHDFTET